MTPEEFHKTDLTGRKVVFRNPQIRHGWIESIFKDGAIICRVAYRGKDTKKPAPDAIAWALGGEKFRQYDTEVNP